MALSHMQSQENDWLSAMPFIQYKGKKNLYIFMDKMQNLIFCKCIVSTMQSKDSPLINGIFVRRSTLA